MIKKILLTLIAVTLVQVALALWLLPGIVHDRVERELRKTFPDAKVAVGRPTVEMPAAIAIDGIDVQADGYSLTARKVSVDWAKKLTLVEPKILIRKVPEAFTGASVAGPEGGSEPVRPKTPFTALEARGLTVELKLPKFQGEIRGNFLCDLKYLQLRSARLESPSLKSGPVQARGIFLDLPGGVPGTLTVDRLDVSRVRITNIRGTVAWEETVIAIDPLTADWVLGTAAGRAHLETETPFAYTANFEIRELDLDALASDLKLKDKMSATGKLAGKMSVRGDAGGIRQLDGELAAGADGGNLVIEDAKLMQGLADNVKQPLPIVEAAFKEYHFDSGSVRVGMSDDNLTLGVLMDGPKGKRDFTITLHDTL